MKQFILFISIVFVSIMCSTSKISKPVYISKIEDNLWKIENQSTGKEIKIVEEYIGIQNNQGVLAGLVCDELGCIVVNEKSTDGYYLTPGLPDIEIYLVTNTSNGIVEAKFLKTTDCNGFFSIKTKESGLTKFIFSFPNGKGSLLYEFNPKNKVDDRNRLKKNFLEC